MSKYCGVCHGRRLISLRTTPEFNAQITEVHEVKINTTTYEEYPCPACAPHAPVERVDVIEYEADVRADRDLGDDPDYRAGIMRQMATRLGRGMLEKGHISFTESPIEKDNYGFDKRKFIARIGVVSTGQAATMQDRIEKHQNALALEVIDEAKRQICIWGSDYNWQSIRKDDAMRMVSESLQIVLKRRAEVKAIASAI